MYLNRPRALWIAHTLLLCACGQQRTPSGHSAAPIEAGSAQAAPPGGGAVTWRDPTLRPPPGPPRATSTEPRPMPVAPYPPAAWRLAASSELRDVVLWVDHILISHREARQRVPFSLGYWYSAPPPSTRSRDEALALAHEIASQAGRAPRAFEQLARQHSEDITTRDEGGALGGVAASALVEWPQVLDALAAIRPGQTSKVVETRYGFHVFRRREPPLEQRLAGSHIVIGHDQAEWLKVQARGPLPSRTRDQALALAVQLQREAAAAPGGFPALVERYSEHRDALAAGDFGDWSSREPCPHPPRLLRLGELAIGEVGTPIETSLGFEVILRTAPRPRERYAARVLELEFDPGAKDGERSSRAAVLADATQMAESLAAEPDRFREARSASLVTWVEGRGLPALSDALARIAIGQVTPAPLLASFAFQIAQRTQPEAPAPERRATELPAPTEPEVEYHLGRMKRASLDALLRATSERLLVERELSAVGVERAGAIQIPAGYDDGSGRSAKRVAVRGFLDETRERLGQADYARFLVALKRELTRALLRAPDDARAALGM